uniref:Uncharacterized protein n=1 Tax=Gasterosteus aculeatus aculeatus TaxID=481459 RepID=A0AAQ4QGN1_GASAC|nr:uncharacterized protein LOC120826868 isoform X1 [Gasterosteus aculeatus aculeatus]
MKVTGAAVLSALFCTVVSASLKVTEEHRTAFFGEDIHIDVPPGDLGEVVFKPRTKSLPEVVLMRAGRVVNPRGSINSLDHLLLEDVQEEDEGVYVIKNTNHPDAVKHLILIVRDCAVEQVVKYGDTYYIHLNRVEGPITLEFRPGLIQSTNHTEIHHATEPPPVVLFNQTAVPAEEYAGRLSVTEKRVMLHAVRMADEGSFTVLDREGKIRRRNCLNVREHQDFIRPSYGENVKIKLYLQHSNVNVVYKPKSDNQDRVIVDQGVLVNPLDPLLEGRLSVQGSQLSIKKVHMADTGVFKVTDLAGFPVAHVYIEVETYKLPPLTVAVLSMLSVIAFMLLMCLLSCIYRMHKRSEKSKKLTLIAQQAGKGDGEAFRQVVHDAYTRFTEESLMQSVCEQPTESTEVTIKGLEVSKSGRYHTLFSDNFLEMSDSGVEFTTSGLPLDSDTDAGTTYASHKPLLNAVFPTAMTEEAPSDCLEATPAPGDDLSAGRSPVTATAGSPASHPQLLDAAEPDGGPRGDSPPGTAPGGTAGSDSAKTEGGAESEDGVQKEESAHST